MFSFCKKCQMFGVNAGPLCEKCLGCNEPVGSPQCLVTWWGGSRRRPPMGMPVCFHCSSFSLLTELFTAQMERDPALYNSPTGSNREKKIQSQKPTDSFSLYTLDYSIYCFFLFYFTHKLCIQVSFLTSTPQHWTCSQPCNKNAVTQCRRCVVEDV